MRKYNKPFKYKVYGEVMAEICDLRDILIGNFSNSVLNNGFRKYRPIYKGVMKRFTNRWDSQWYNKDSAEVIEKSMRRITKIFLDKMLTDIIVNDYEFVMPGDVFRLSMGYKTWTDPAAINKFKYNIKTGGLTFTPRIVFDRKVFLAMNRTRYYFKLVGNYERLFKYEINSNKY